MNQYFDKGLNRFATGDIDWINHLIYVSLIFGVEYIPDFVNDEFLNDIPEDALASTIVIVGRVTDGAGTMDGDDITFPSVLADTRQCTALVIWRSIGASKLLSPLIAWIDEVTELPLVPSGINESFTWDNGSNKILTLNET